MTIPAGTHLGPYEIQGVIGAGGMGEVYRARDPRLSREVAVKLITADGASSPERLSRFETEARAAAQLAHPNVVTVFDVGNHEGHPYLVLELLDGQTLREVIRAGTPPLRQSLTWALEAARGLGAAHERGIIHRDLKPENIFLTSGGRVKVLDFGLAKLQEPLVGSSSDTSNPTATKDTSPGVILGTIGYMAPEQVKGEVAGARSDIFALGAVLYELVSGQRAFSGATSAEILASILRDEPTSLMNLRADTPVSVETVVRRCLGKHPSERFSTGNEVAAALETVLSSFEPSRATATRVLEPRGPYPGLSSFTEADAERFFGRESEIESLWDKLRQRRLLALIGPSGAGKTSFVRAGLIPSRPTGWGTIAASPGAAPMKGLAQALVGALPSDPDTMRELLAFDDPEVAFRVLQKWRKSHLECLLVLDQFEELFTLNPPEVQAEFTELLGRLVTEGDVHVLLSMRDDFLIRCYDHQTLVPVFQNLTPLVSLGGEDLRRALVEPAKKEGFSFENEGLVDEMLESVEGARGALPLLAFAVARLWEKRDRENKLLTRKAYEAIGGVAGALAQHAEQTLERIGLDREPVVRELFRNLVTAQWTRAVAGREELLSVVPDRDAATQVLDELIDARLLTSYEVRDPDRPVSGSHPERSLSGDGTKDAAATSTGAMRVGTTHRIEIVHESLLRAWPRLVRWQAQDEEGSVLRDQLKQGAHLWEEKSRSPDVLWTGTAFQEFELWRERYPGKLTALEEDYSSAMVDRAQWRRRFRRLVTASVVAVALAVSVVTGTLWWRSERAREQARAEARRAEASKLLALAQLRIEEDPTEALALTTASLELADGEEGRLLALKALSETPPALELDAQGVSAAGPAFSPDGSWLAAAGFESEVGVWSRDGTGPLRLPGHEPNPNGNRALWSAGGSLVTGVGRGFGQRVHVWSLPEGKRVRTVEFGRASSWWVRGDHIVARTPEPSNDGMTPRELRRILGGRAPGEVLLRAWKVPEGAEKVLGRVQPWALGSRDSHLDVTSWVYAKGRDIMRRSLPVVPGTPDELLARHSADGTFIGGFPRGSDGFFTRDRSGEFRLYGHGSTGGPLATIPPPRTAADPGRNWLDSTGRWVLGLAGLEKEARLWAADALPGARPLRLRRSGSWYGVRIDVHPDGEWLVASTGDWSRLTFWPLTRRWPQVIDGYKAIVRPLAFSPDGRWLASAWSDSTIRLWPVPTADAEPARVLELPEGAGTIGLTFSPGGGFLFVTDAAGRALVVPVSGAPIRALSGFSQNTLLCSAAVSPSGHRVATAFCYGGGPKKLRVWNLKTDEQMVFDLPVPEAARPDEGETPQTTGYEGGVMNLWFLDESTLLSGGHGGVRRWDLEQGTHEIVWASEAGRHAWVQVSADRRTAFTIEHQPGQNQGISPTRVIDLESGGTRTLPLGAEDGLFCFSGPEGKTMAAGGVEGLVRVRSLDGESAHLLVGHVGPVDWIAISPDLRWVASSGQDNTLRLWPMPDLDEPPLQTLPRDALLAKLKSLTNIRAVRDAETSTGWSIELDPFPGWKEVPEW